MPFHSRHWGSACSSRITAECDGPCEHVMWTPSSLTAQVAGGLWNIGIGPPGGRRDLGWAAVGQPRVGPVLVAVAVAADLLICTGARPAHAAILTIPRSVGASTLTGHYQEVLIPRSSSVNSKPFTALQNLASAVISVSSLWMAHSAKSASKNRRLRWHASTAARSRASASVRWMTTSRSSTERTAATYWSMLSRPGISPLVRRT